VLKTEGLREMLAWLREQMRELHGLTVDLQAEADARITNHDLRVLLFQIVRELLFNVTKHAGVSEAAVRIARAEDGHITVHVTDEGAGFDTTAAEWSDEHEGGFGLFSARERLRLLGGGLEVTSAPGEGTHVTIHAPPPDADPADAPPLPPDDDDAA
jgi:signal transduction histidine kinase